LRFFVNETVIAQDEGHDATGRDAALVRAMRSAQMKLPASLTSPACMKPRT
jgi:hypothetical protein